MASSLSSSRSLLLNAAALQDRYQLSRDACWRLKCTATSEAPSSFSSDQLQIVPRRCTLKELTFSEDGRLIRRNPSPAGGQRTSELMDLFLATVEAQVQVQNLETLTGRLAMIAFFAAIAMEYMTGSGVFSGIDAAGLQKGLGLSLLTAMGAGAFAVTIRGKKNVTDVLANNCQSLMDSTVDNLVNALFYEEEVVLHSSDEKQA